jgi:hypothetical protein
MPVGLVIAVASGGILLVASAWVLGRRLGRMRAVPAAMGSSFRSARARVGKPAAGRHLVGGREQVAAGLRHTSHTRRRLARRVRQYRSQIVVYGFATSVGIAIGIVAGLYL